MRRVARDLFTLCSALSLLLCVAVCAVGAELRLPRGDRTRRSDALRTRPLPALGHRFQRRAAHRLARVGNRRASLAERGRRNDAERVGRRSAARRDGCRRPVANRGIPLPRAHSSPFADDKRAPPIDGGNRFARGFGAGRGYYTSSLVMVARSGFVVPHWFVALVLAVLPAVVAATRLAARRRRRQRTDVCANCGYDLRASPERCPECGAAVPTR
jgi:hypothetical protein